MPLGELVGKLIGVFVVTAALVGSGIAVIVGQHAQSTALMDTFLGVALILVGLMTVGFGAVSILGSLWEAKQRRREAVVHITPRNGPPSVPPAWGMSDVGRPNSGVHMSRALAVGPGTSIGRSGGGSTVGMARGSVRVVAMAGHNWDIPLGIGLLLAWTTVGCVIWSILAPH